VLIAIVIGACVGLWFPHVGTALKPLADGFIKLIKMLLAPIIFGTVVVGMAKMGDLKEVGRIGVKALVYFEVLSTIALVVGLVVVNVLKPGAGMNIDASNLDGHALAGFTEAAKEQGVVPFLMDIIPTTLVDAFAKGAMLQVILLSVLIGAGVSQMGARAKPLIETIDLFLEAIFKVVGMVMRLAPLGAGAGVAFTIGKYGIGTLWSLAHLLIALYVTSLFFVVVVLGGVMRSVGLPFWSFLRFIREEIFVVLGTCSTEAVLPRLMQKLEDMGCAKPVVGLVLPTGYTFNADGTCIYLTLATVFVAQATNTHLGTGRSAGDPGGAAADLEGFGRRGGRGLHHPGRDPVDPARGAGQRPGPAAGRRPLPQRGARRHQPDRQQRRHRGHRQVGRRAGHGQGARDSCAGNKPATS
jgi:aerobic C4-dicarboxylate transport protein